MGFAQTIELLSLVGNKLKGGIPKELAKLQALEKLDLNGHPLAGAIPPGLVRLSALEELNLGLSLLICIALLRKKLPSFFSIFKTESAIKSTTGTTSTSQFFLYIFRDSALTSELSL